MVQHLSIRIPWKDNGYNGQICNKPCFNNSCLRLKNIAESRDDVFENELAGLPIKGHESEIPCLSEGGCFMSSETYIKHTVHPYKKSNPGTHGHFLDTELRYPPYSLPARPFAWTMLDGSDYNNINCLVDRYAINYNSEREPLLPFSTSWVQDAENQRAIFETFYEDVEPNSSLVIPYAKQVPFIDDSRRVVMGLGFVTSVTPPPEHNHTNEGVLRSILWETMIGHSIRNDRKNGFLLPYIEMMHYAEEHPEFDLTSITVFAEDDYFKEFSYATEHLSYDAVISVLLQTIKALEIIKNCIPGNWNECLLWTKNRLKEVWLQRGVYPGLATMLRVMGFRYSEVVAKKIKSRSNPTDIEEDFINALRKPADYFSETAASGISCTLVNTFISLNTERKVLFWLMSRMSLNDFQADIFNPEWRKNQNIDLTDKEIIENPYILYEKTRNLAPEYIIPVKKIDMAIFPPENLRAIKPLSEPTKLDSTNDKRRIRAYAVNSLENQAALGNTVFPVDRIINEINSLAVEPALHITEDIINGIQLFLEEELKPIDCADGRKAYQLNRLHKIDEVIRSSVNKRLKGKRHIINENWRKIVDEAFSGKENTEFEERARTEKAAILKELAESRLSVLIGGAGTGKTTLLALLCKSPQIRDGGVLLLAPTGKLELE